MSLRLKRGDSEDTSFADGDAGLDLQEDIAQLEDWRGGGLMFWAPQDPAENAADFEAGDLGSWLNTSVIPADAEAANGLADQQHPQQIARPSSTVHGSFMLPDPSAAISTISDSQLQVSAQSHVHALLPPPPPSRGVLSPSCCPRLPSIG